MVKITEPKINFYINLVAELARMMPRIVTMDEVISIERGNKQTRFLLRGGKSYTLKIEID